MLLLGHNEFSTALGNLRGFLANWPPPSAPGLTQAKVVVNQFSWVLIWPVYSTWPIPSLLMSRRTQGVRASVAKILTSLSRTISVPTPEVWRIVKSPYNLISPRRWWFISWWVPTEQHSKDYFSKCNSHWRPGDVCIYFIGMVTIGL